MIFIIKIIFGYYERIYLSAYSIDLNFINPLYKLDNNKKKINIIFNTKRDKIEVYYNYFLFEDLLIYKIFNVFPNNKKVQYIKNILNVIFLKIIVSYGRYKVLISGSTGLMKFNKSKNKRHIHIIHSMASLHTIYFNNSFYFFDHIFLTNKKQLSELKLIKNRDSNITANGTIMGYVDFNYNQFKLKKDRINILIAPSWFHPDAFNKILKKYIFKNLSLCSRINKIYIRPHPGLSVDDINLIKKIASDNSYNLDIHISVDTVLQTDFEQTNIMITDCSGVGIQYALQYLTPTFFIKETPTKQNNKYFKDGSIESLERDLSYNFGYEILFKNDQFLLNKLLTKYLNSEITQLEWKSKLIQSRNTFLHDSNNYALNAINKIESLITPN